MGKLRKRARVSVRKGTETRENGRRGGRGEQRRRA